jgi:hypothetical protein
MPKVYKVRAKVSTYYSAYVQVPDSWTEEDITDWYEYNGAGGEFTEEHEHAEWDLLWPVECNYDAEPDMIFKEETSK